MKISKIVFRDSNDKDKALIECDIIFDGVLKVIDVRLYSKQNKYYLIFPSKQDIAKDVLDENKGKDIVKPSCLSPSRRKNWEEFYYPIDSAFYTEIRDTVVEGYKTIKISQNKTYIPNN